MIIDSFLDNGKPVCIAIRETEYDEYPLWQRLVMINEVYKEQIKDGLVKVITIPDIDTVAIGRGVGYSLVEVPEDIKLISGSSIRESGNLDYLPVQVRRLILEWENDRCVLCGQCRKEDCGSSDEDEQELQSSE